MVTKTKKKAAEQAAPVTPQEKILALMAEVAELSAEAAKLQAVIDATPVGQKLAEFQKALKGADDELRKLCEKGEGVTHTPYGTVGYTPRETKVYDPAAVRELAPQLYSQVVAEKVDAAALRDLVKLGVKHKTLAPDTLDQLDGHVLTETKVVWAFSCKLGGGK